MHSKQRGHVSDAKLSHSDLVFNIVSSRPAPVVPGPGKVIKIRPKHFLVVLTKNRKKHAPNSVGTFQMQNCVIRARISTLLASLVPGPKKVVKIRPKHFSVLLLKK